MTADTHATRPTDRLAHLRASFRRWRGQRPFWGGLLTLLAGIPIMYIPYQNFTLGSLTVRMSTTGGAGSLIIGVLLVVLGLIMWFQAHSRVFAGVAAIMLALVSLVVSNFGAFGIGFVLGLLGGGLGVAWAPAAAAAPAPSPAPTLAPDVPEQRVAEPAAPTALRPVDDDVARADVAPADAARDDAARADAVRPYLGKEQGSAR